MQHKIDSGYDTRPKEDADTRIDLATAVAKLPPRQQVIVALRCDGYTQQSITQLLGISRTTVWADEKSALAALASLIVSETIEDSEDIRDA